MSDWIDFRNWKDCGRMERPGTAFEVVNAEGQSIVTRCVEQLQTPADWKSGPLRFRVVALARPRHSDPMPTPSGRSPAPK